jgi:hypothetical protein
VYFRQTNNVLQIITVWVDDLLVITKTEESMRDLKQELGTLFEITDLGNPNKIVGIEITRTENSISICQKQYTMSILQSEGMQDANPVSTPLDPNMKLEPIPEGSIGDRSNSFAVLMGKLQYLATATRPDIAFAVNRLAAYTANPNMSHYTAAIEIPQNPSLDTQMPHMPIPMIIALSSTEAEYVALCYY